MSFRICDLETFAALLAENPKGAVLLRDATVTNGTVHDVSDRDTQTLAEFVIICDRIMRYRRDAWHGEDFHQMETTQIAAAIELAHRARVNRTPA